MSNCWIIGRKVTLPNGHETMAEPYIVFDSEEEADTACAMVERVSGERPTKREGARYNISQRR